MKWNIKMMFMTMILSSMMVVSSSNWLSMWMGMEINMISFVPMMVLNNKEPSKSMMIYFLVQSISSSMLLYSLMTMWLLSPGNHSSLLINMMMVSMMIKSGLAPMHTWAIIIMNNMSWIMCIILMSWQKLAPLSVMFTISESKTMLTMACISAMVGSIGGINQTSLRKLMGYSSISHMGWMLTMAHSNKWLLYLFMYSLTAAMTMMMFSKENLFHINQLSMMNKTNKISLSINMLSMSGLPPLMGFLPKWMAVQYMIESKMIIMLLIMIMSSLLTLMYYMSIMFPIMMMSMTSNKTMVSYTENNYSMLTIMSLTMPVMLTLNALI
nr:NADH dehydrogenase subunit 2 [Brachyrhynchus triangulus]